MILINKTNYSLTGYKTTVEFPQNNIQNNSYRFEKC